MLILHLSKYCSCSGYTALVTKFNAILSSYSGIETIIKCSCSSCSDSFLLNRGLNVIRSVLLPIGSHSLESEMQGFLLILWVKFESAFPFLFTLIFLNECHPFFRVYIYWWGEEGAEGGWLQALQYQKLFVPF
jgi:hypothetical protein